LPDHYLQTFSPTLAEATRKGEGYVQRGKKREAACSRNFDLSDLRPDRSKKHQRGTEKGILGGRGKRGRRGERAGDSSLPANMMRGAEDSRRGRKGKKAIGKKGKTA